MVLGRHLAACLARMKPTFQPKVLETLYSEVAGLPPALVPGVLGLRALAFAGTLGPLLPAGGPCPGGEKSSLFGSTGGASESAQEIRLRVMISKLEAERAQDRDKFADDALGIPGLYVLGYCQEYVPSAFRMMRSDSEANTCAP